jgi:hypothetical protein
MCKSSDYETNSKCIPQTQKLQALKKGVLIRIHHQCKLLTRAVKDDKLKAQRKAKLLGFLTNKINRR